MYMGCDCPSAEAWHPPPAQHQDKTVREVQKETAGAGQLTPTPSPLGNILILLLTLNYKNVGIIEYALVRIVHTCGRIHCTFPATLSVAKLAT